MEPKLILNAILVRVDLMVRTIMYTVALHRVPGIQASDTGLVLRYPPTAWDLFFQDSTADNGRLGLEGLSSASASIGPK